MVAFEPSTWAEVEEAEAMGKASLRPTNPLVTEILRFTTAPERCLTSPPADPASLDPAPPRPLSPTPDPPRVSDKPDGAFPAPAETPHPNARYNIPPQRLIRAKRNNMHFEDLLRLGRVNLQTAALARWRNAKSNSAMFERSLAADAAHPIAQHASPVNPSCPHFDPDAYLARVHAATSRTDLAQGLKNLRGLLALMDGQADALRASAYPSVCLAAAELERTRDLIASRAGTAPAAADAGCADGAAFAAAERILKARYSAVLRRSEEVEQLQRVLGIVARFEWVFTLGRRMRDAGALPIEAVERMAREFARAREWVDAQDPLAVARVARDLDEGVRALARALTARLGHAKTSRVQMKRVVSVLASVDCEASIRAALQQRWDAAAQRVEAAARVVDGGGGCGAEPPGPGAPRAPYVRAVTAAFVAGLSTYWRLACVVMPYESCSMHVFQSLPALIGRYVQLVRDLFKAGAAVLSREVVVEVMRAQVCCAVQLKIPQEYMPALQALMAEVATDFVKGTAAAVASSARQIALDVMRDRSKAADAAALVQFVVFEALAQVQDILQKPLWMRSGSRKADLAKGEPDVRQTAGGYTAPAESAIETLRDVCIAALATTAEVLEESLGQINDGVADHGARALLVAVFCVRAKGRTLDAIHEKTCSVLGVDEVEEKYDSALGVIDRVRGVAIQGFVRSVAPSLEKIGERIVAYPNRTGTEQTQRVYNWRIKTVSPQATELLLELALSAADTRRRGADAQVVYEVTKELITRVGNAIEVKVKAARLLPEHAAQVWVDCTYIANVVSSAIPAEGDERYAILSGLTQAIQGTRSMLAAEGTGSDGFRPQALADNAVAPAVDDAEILRRCLVGDCASAPE